MKVHQVKSWPLPFEEVSSGRKVWEFRLNDRGYLPGDFLDMREWDAKTSSYTGRGYYVRIQQVRGVSQYMGDSRPWVVLDLEKQLQQFRAPVPTAADILVKDILFRLEGLLALVAELEARKP